MYAHNRVFIKLWFVIVKSLSSLMLSNMAVITDVEGTHGVECSAPIQSTIQPLPMS